MLQLLASLTIFAEAQPQEVATWTAVALSTALVIERMFGRWQDAKERDRKAEREQHAEEQKRKWDSQVVEMQKKQKDCAEAEQKHKQEMAIVYKDLADCREKHREADRKMEEERKETNRRFDELTKIVSQNQGTINEIRKQQSNG